MGAASSVSRVENGNTQVLGSVFKATQPIFVDRFNTKNKSFTVDEIKRRAMLNNDWPQTLIYAEGTTTNRSSLISFKPGLNNKKKLFDF